MGFSDPNLADLGDHLGDALESIKRAGAVAVALCGDIEMGDRMGWTEMEALSVMLDAIERLLAELPGPGLAVAIEAERAYQDEMSDRADGLSY